MNAEAPGDVVRGRDDSAAARIAADDERLRSELWVLELLNGGVERIEVEVRNDHRLRLVQASGGLDRLPLWPFSNRGSSAAPTSSRAVTSGWLRSLRSCTSAPSRLLAAAATRPWSATGRAASS